ncbi:MAG TPA: M55 family metallopeptidase [Blastocatellia bacterium]|nr:M55 family metallopeptidase [Blastocatellia bacterium]
MNNGSRVLAVVAAAVMATMLAPSPRAQTRKLKIYISADMEGVVGVVTADQLTPQGFEYNRYREFMTNEVNAACQAALDAGATDIVISDSHGNGENLLVEKLPKNVTLVRAFPRHLGMMAGIDGTFDGVIFIGYHASTSNSQGVRAHTISSARLADVRLNGVSVTEGAMNAAIAGHFNVPVIMISGDDAAVKEVSDAIGPIEGAVVKWSLGFHSARTLTPEVAYELIRERVRKAIGRISEFKPYRLKTPVELDVRFKNYRPAEVLAYLPIVKRIDSHTVRFVGKDMLEVSGFMEFVTTYEPGLEP